MRTARQAEKAGRLAWIYEDTANQKPGGKGVASKFKSAWKLTTGEQGLLSALIAWREDESHRLDRPRSWILPDKVMVALARRAPAHIAQLKQIEGLPEAIIRKRGQRLIELLADARSRKTTAYFGQPLLAAWNGIGWPRWHRVLKPSQRN